MKTPLIGGFHSPLEQSMHDVMLAAQAPVVMVIARKLEAASLPAVWRDAVQAGTVAVVSMDDTRQRLTAGQAIRRNHWIARHAAHIVVAELHGVGAWRLVWHNGKIENMRVSILLNEIGK